MKVLVFSRYSYSGLFIAGLICQLVRVRGGIIKNKLCLFIEKSVLGHFDTLSIHLGPPVNQSIWYRKADFCLPSIFSGLNGCFRDRESQTVCQRFQVRQVFFKEAANTQLKHRWLFFAVHFIQLAIVTAFSWCVYRYSIDNGNWLVRSLPRD